MHGIDDNPDNDAMKGAVLGAVGGAAVGALAGGPVGALIGAVAGGIASGVGVAAVDRIDNDNTFSGLNDEPTLDLRSERNEARRSDNTPGIQAMHGNVNGNGDSRTEEDKAADRMDSKWVDDTSNLVDDTPINASESGRALRNATTTGKKAMNLNTLNELYINELKDLFSAETQILRAMPDIIEAATATDLKAGFEAHRKQTEIHVDRLIHIFQQLGTSPSGKHCKGMEGIIAEGSDLIKERPDPQVLDAGLISAAQHVEHYEMAGYGTCRTYARLLGDDEAADLLQTTLDEEQASDEKLTQLAVGHINLAAV